MSEPASRPIAPAVARNRDAILHVLRTEFAERQRVLEIGSGTGEHGVHFAAAMPWLTWQLSDRGDNHAGIEAWVEHAKLDNLSGPLELDVDAPPEFKVPFDAVFSANTAHIMSESQVQATVQLVGRILPEGGRFALYGPFKVDGGFTSESNARFDASLRAQQPHMGIRALEDLDQWCADAGVLRRSLYAMPANNFVVVWQRFESGNTP